MCHAAAALGARAACCVGFHPSPSAELLRGGTPGRLVARAARGGRCAILLCPAGNDPPDVQPGGAADRVLRGEGCAALDANATSSYPHAVRAFPEQLHGWVNRGDLRCPAVARDVEGALALGLGFLRRHLLRLPGVDGPVAGGGGSGDEGGAGCSHCSSRL